MPWGRSRICLQWSKQLGPPSIAYIEVKKNPARAGSSTTPNNYTYLSFVATASATTATVTASSNHPPENTKVVTNAEIASQNWFQ